jgi:peptidyl-prolyl cis-trans isomerase D
MLNLFRKHATSWLIKVALFLIVIVFIFWGGYSYNSQKASQMARVDDHYISINDYNQAYNQLLEVYRRQFGDAFSEDLIRRFNLKKQALDMLINRYVLTKAAQELGLTATAREIQDQVLEYPVFQKDGKFDQNLYVRVLQQNRLTPEAFEQKLAEDLTTRKLESFIKRQAVVTEGEIRSDFLFNHSTIQLDYVILDPKSYENQVTIDEKAVETYFKEHQDRYKDPEKRQISYVLFKTDDYLANVQVTNDEILQKYEENKDQYHHEPEVHARHILFIVTENAPEAEVAKVRSEAQKVLDEVKKGKDFSELAKKYSQDPSAAQNGGDLGYFKRHEMVDAFSDAAFAMKPGQISDLVRSPYGFHIIKVEDVRPERTESLEEARAAIEKSLKEEKARELAYEKAQAFEDVAYARKDVGKTAEEQKVQLMGNGVWVSESDSLSGLKEADPALMKKIFALGEKEVSDVLETPEGYLVAEVTAVQGPQVPPLEKVKDRVQEDLKKEKAGELAKAKASELLSAAKNLKSLEQAAREMKMDVRKSDWFSRREPDNDLLLLQGNALNSVFQMEESNPFPEAPLSLGNRYAVVQLLGKKSSEEGLEKERDSISRRLYQMKQGMLWQSWIEEERSKAKVEIYKEL